MNNRNNLFNLLERLPTEDLELMLQNELLQETPDEHATRLILNVLKDRDTGQDVIIDSKVEAAWGKYQSDTELPKRKPELIKNWLLRAAAVAAVLCIIMFAIPQSAEAESFIGMMTRWTDSIFEFFDPRDRDTNKIEYEFKTDHLGLQQVYDAVVEMGVADPVVPMWLPEEYELISCDVSGNSRRQSLVAHFSDGTNAVVLQIDSYDEDTVRSYQKDNTFVKYYEINGVNHTIFRNNNRWVALWVTERTGCSFTIACQEDELFRILKSIYDMEA